MYTPKGELNDNLLELMQNAEAVKAFEGCKSPEEGYEVVKKYLPDISMEEFQGSMQVMAAYLEEQTDGLLSDEDLDEVAGGKGDSKPKTVLDIVNLFPNDSPVIFRPDFFHGLTKKP